MTKAMILASCHEKGGVGKTTSVVSIGHGLALRGKRVLLLDCDTQNQLAWFLGLRENTDIGLGDKLLDEENNIPLSNFILPTERQGLDVIPAGTKLPLAVREISKRMIAPEQALTEAMSTATELYDYILLDMSPNWDPFTVNCMMFVRGLLCPLHLDWPSVDSLGKLLRDMEPAQKYNKALEILLFIPTHYDSRLTESRHILEELKKKFGEKVCPPIRKTVRYGKAAGRGKTIYEYDPSAADDYERIVDRIENL